MTALMRAARIGDVEGCAAELADGASPDARDAAGWTALTHAAAGGHEPVVELLLERGADPAVEAFDFVAPLHAAVAGEHLRVVRRLVAAGAPATQSMGPPPRGWAGVQDYWTPLRLAAAAGHAPLINALHRGGARPHGGTVARFIAGAVERAGGEVQFFDRGESQDEMFGDDVHITPDVFVVTPAEALPTAVPRCMKSLARYVDGRWHVSDDDDEVHGALATFVGRGSEPDKGCTLLGPAHEDYGDWREWGSSITLQQVLHEGSRTALNSLLWLCSLAGNVPLVRALLDRGAKANSTRRDAIGVATYHKHTEVVLLLARRTGQAHRALGEAAGDGDTRSVTRLLRAGADPSRPVKGNNALIRAVLYGGKVAVVRRLLAAGAPADSASRGGIPALVLAADRGPPGVLRLLIDAGADVDAVNPGDGATALHAAVRNDSLAKVTALLAATRDPDAAMAGGRTALHLAGCHFPNVRLSIARRLVAAGARCDARDNAGFTPLLAALDQATNRPVIRYLIRAGSDVEATDARGRSALMIAIAAHCGEMVGDLLRGGAAADRTDAAADTALILACRMEATLAVSALVDAGADVQARNRAGESALSLAHASGSAYLVRLVEAARAQT